MESKFKMAQEGKGTVFVGLVCLDIFNVMEKFPIEDQGHRCLDCIWQRGGNASNSANVFSLLGGNAFFFGTIAQSPELQYLKDDFALFNICIDNCVILPNTSCPVSTVISCLQTGTRTVLHTNKNLRELTVEDFSLYVDKMSGKLDWVHFEGRDNALEISRMFDFLCRQGYSGTHCDGKKEHLVVSLEAEKLRFAAGMEKYNLWKFPDVMFVSKDFAKSQGCDDMLQAVKYFFTKVKKGAILICAWGEEGAAAMSAETGLLTASACPPEKIVDTCGAGDTFNASVIFALLKGKSLQEAIVFGCRVAGAKCGTQGYRGIEKFVF